MGYSIFSELNVAWILNLTAFIGILILSIPVWSLNFRKKKLQKIKNRSDKRESSSKFRVKLRSASQRKREEGVAEWRRIDQFCLTVGYSLLLGSSFLRLFL